MAVPYGMLAVQSLRVTFHGSERSVLNGEAEKTALPRLIQEKLSILSLFFQLPQTLHKITHQRWECFSFYLKGALCFTRKETIHILPFICLVWFFSCTDW